MIYGIDCETQKEETFFGHFAYADVLYRMEWERESEREREREREEWEEEEISLNMDGSEIFRNGYPVAAAAATCYATLDRGQISGKHH
jgi:hypothetical protein